MNLHLENILNNYLPFFSALVGAIVGGLIAWLNIKYSLNKQFRELRLREELQEQKNLRIAINSIQKEIDYNLIQFNSIKKLMDAKKIDFIDFKGSQQNNNLKMDKWEKHSDIIELEEIDFLSTLQAFYINLSYEVNNQASNRERAVNHIKMGLDLRNKLKVLLDEQSKEVKKVKS